ncbi:helix-turn-helix domain-containing protein [Chryseobacterium sp.]|uniref:helix-turn-helix domain-containing protein n=1 Tax=Chryseobacterium sp. TaxID=1871047 RepID=UPI0011C917D5|nr:helix-turn-helix domain-containing protein [Chryseobacterium sp.]TXF77799.1 AraC family transcriptional regulator [Chryseobacterium sp.]
MSKIMLIICFAIGCVSNPAQDRTGVSFKQFENIYETYKENDGRALPFVRMHIEEARRKNHIKELLNAYENGVFFSPKGQDKLLYADSAVAAARTTKDADLISRAYLGKGIVYYFTFKKYQPALNEYLKANEYSGSIKDPYLQYKILYHLGTVKSYLGYYEEALEHFRPCLTFFEANLTQKEHPNDIYNNTRGYLNTLHQMVVCYQHLEQWVAADSLTARGEALLNRRQGFDEEKGYLYKCRGLSEFRKENYSSAVELLTLSNRLLSTSDDFAWMALNDFYIGKSYFQLNKKDMALEYFRKVDSSFIRHRFILPELRENYEVLISFYKEKRKPVEELYYTRQLLKADEFLASDFSYLAARVYKEYDTKTLREEKFRLENAGRSKSRFILLISVTGGLIIIFLLYRYQKARKITEKYRLLLKRRETASGEIMVIPPKERVAARKYGYSEEVTNEILEKLRKFEEKKEFTAKGLTLRKLADKLGTNTPYLSFVINDFKGMHFNTYLKELRITYITNLLCTEKKYLNYTIEGLAEECGIASRQNFSDHFYEINGLRPKDFIDRRKKELRTGD